MELKKCSNCGCSFSLDNFRRGKNQCKECERKIQRDNRRERKKLTGKRFDDSYNFAEDQKIAMFDLTTMGYSQQKVADVFKTDQSNVSRIVGEVCSDRMRC